MFAGVRFFDRVRDGGVWVFGIVSVIATVGYVLSGGGAGCGGIKLANRLCADESRFAQEDYRFKEKSHEYS